MGLYIQIEHNFLEVASLFDKHKKEIVKAARFGINRSLLTIRQESIPMIKRNINMKTTAIRKRAKIERVRGGGLSSLQGSVDYSTIPVGLIEFIKGSKQPISQKGVPVKKRRKLRIEITPGRRLTLKSAFIQKVRSTQVFKGRRGKGFHKQGVPSIGWVVFNRDNIANKLMFIGQDRFKKLFNEDLQKRIDGTFAAFNSRTKVK